MPSTTTTPVSTITTITQTPTTTTQMTPDTTTTPTKKDCSEVCANDTPAGYYPDYCCSAHYCNCNGEGFGVGTTCPGEGEGFCLSFKGCKTDCDNDEGCCAK